MYHILILLQKTTKYYSIYIKYNGGLKMNKNKSTFLGSNWGIIWRNVLLGIGVTFSLFIASPWLLSWYYKWYWSNIKIDDKLHKFTGKANDMFFVYIYYLVTF